MLSLSKKTHPEFTINVQQNAILTGDIVSHPATLYFEKNHREPIEFNVDEEFELFDESASRFQLIVEFENDNLYEIWEIPLSVIDLSCNDFSLKKCNDLEQLIHFIEKLELNSKLDTQLSDKKSSPKNKI